MLGSQGRKFLLVIAFLSGSPEYLVLVGDKQHNLVTFLNFHLMFNEGHTRPLRYRPPLDHIYPKTLPIFLPFYLQKKVFSIHLLVHLILLEKSLSLLPVNITNSKRASHSY